jgi:serine O-acetyltransferase
VEHLVYWRKIPILGLIAGGILRVLGVSWPSSVRPGPGLMLPHGAVGLVVHENSIIGCRVKLYQGVTLGRSDVHKKDSAAGGRIQIGDDVIIGAGATVLFPSGGTVSIGAGSVIGANSVVTNDIAPSEVWSGNPARKTADRR